MDLTGITILNSAISAVGMSNIRSGSTEYRAVDGVRVSNIEPNRLRFEQGFKFLTRNSPEVKSQTIDINKNGSSPIVYTNKRGVSHYFTRCIPFNHHYRGASWNAELKLGASIGRQNFNLPMIGSTPITFY